MNKEESIDFFINMIDGLTSTDKLISFSQGKWIFEGCVDTPFDDIRDIIPVERCGYKFKHLEFHYNFCWKEQTLTIRHNKGTIELKKDEAEEIIRKYLIFYDD